MHSGAHVNDFLFELGTEELPVAAVKDLSQALKEKFSQALQVANIPHGEIACFGTPRRLAVFIKDMALVQAAQVISRRGPAVAGSKNEHGQPMPALLGFAKSCGVSVDVLQTITTDKGTWWVYESVKSEIETKTLLPSMIIQVLAELPIKKPMRWGEGEQQFSRPVHWALLLLGHEVLTMDVLGVRSQGITYGHRFHHPEAISITSPSSYKDRLFQAKVVVDFNQRRQMIGDKVTQLASLRQLEAVIPDALLDEVTSIVEWPQALEARFDDKFLDVPSEVLIAAMQIHQKSFALRDKKGNLAPYFIAVANIESQDITRVIAGNEKVMHARLSDAAFFYMQDKKLPISEQMLGLHHLVYQAKLGTMADKVTRIAKITASLQHALHLDLDQVSRATALCKCDLLTGMVGEFPDLQGVMGYYYALYNKESPVVALAIKEQYLPKFAKDSLPESALGLALSLADRMDTLVGLFAIGQKPTGVKDPFKLRRHALAVVRMLVTIPDPIRLSELIAAARLSYEDKLPDCREAMEELRGFILERLQSYYLSQGLAIESVHAVRACQEEWLFDVDQRMTAVQSFIQAPEALALSLMAKRVVNVLTQAKWVEESVDPLLFKEPIEQELFAKIEAMKLQIASTDLLEDYPARLNLLVTMQQPLDRFFAEVLVMSDDIALRNNRLALLSRLRVLLGSVADLGLLVIAKR